MNTNSGQPDNDLQRLLKESLMPQPLSNEQIEELSVESDAVLRDEEQFQRILDRVDRLDHVTAGSEHQSSPASTPRLVEYRPARAHANTEQRLMRRNNPNRRGAVAALVVSALGLLAAFFVTSDGSARHHEERIAARQAQQKHVQRIRRSWMLAKHMAAPVVERVAIGDVIETGDRERRRVTLPDGSVLYVNEGTSVEIATDRRVNVDRGEVFVEVVPQFADDHSRAQFEIVTPTRTVTALGTKFGVDAGDNTGDVLVTQGKVKVSGVDDVVAAGQRLKASPSGPTDAKLLAAYRASEHLSWTRELMTAASEALVPRSEHTGGSIISVDPNGQEMKLSLRKYHVDVHIEDGFARTTIDQTYFNHTQRRLEGTFHFPLPPDASLSRLAMYVNGKLMEGGMAERQHARNTFEKIVHKMKDPALLEWVDGSTFKMRVFPLEPRQEKRIVLSYSQRLNFAYGKTYYRFPAGHSMDGVQEWSAGIRVKDGARRTWHSPSHQFKTENAAGDLVLSTKESNSRMDKDLVLELADSTSANDREITNWTSCEHEGHRYLMLRYQPDLPSRMKRRPRHWTFLVEASADRNPVLARTQIEILRTLLDNAEHSDTFHLITANTKATALSKEPLKCSADNIAKAILHLEQTHLIGALDLEKALRKAGRLLQKSREKDGAESGSKERPEKVFVHLGSGIPVLGEHDQGELLRQLPQDAAYVGVGVGKMWSQTFMKSAAGRTGGYFTQINPDEEVAWRAFELSSVLNTPRLLDVGVSGHPRASDSDRGEQRDERERKWLNFADTVVQGEEICAVTRLKNGEKLPKSITVAGLLNGKPWKQALKVRNVAKKAEYLPRTWAKLEIDRLVADSAIEHKSDIIRLSKSMYVMSPFTSLLVLENEEMYTQHNIDRGRKDHWALYACPDEIQVVREPIESHTETVAASGTDSWMETVLTLPPMANSSVAGRAIQRSNDSFTRWYGYVPRESVDTNAERDFVTITLDDLGFGDSTALYSVSNAAAGDLPQWRLRGRLPTNGRWRFEGSSRNDLGGFAANEHWGFPVSGKKSRGLSRQLFDAPSDVAFTRSFVVPSFVVPSESAFQIGDIPVAPSGVDGEISATGFMSRFGRPSQMDGQELLTRRPREFRGRNFSGVLDTTRLQRSPVDRLLEIRSRQELTIQKELVDLARPGLGVEADVMLGRLTSRNNQRRYLQYFARSPEELGEDQNANGLVTDEYMLQLPQQSQVNVPHFGWASTELDWNDGWWPLDSDTDGIQDTIWVDGRAPSGLALTIPEVPLAVERTELPGLNSVAAVQNIGAIRFRQVNGDEIADEIAPLLEGMLQQSPPSVLRFRGGWYYESASPPHVSQDTLRQFELLTGQVIRQHCDLISRAPGLNTSRADMLALAEQHRESNVVRGEVDKGAQNLIRRARKTGWEKITLPPNDSGEAFTVICDGRGRHVYERVISEGLREQVICDGESLTHIYDQIGLASTRSFSRHHRRTISTLVPWLVPAAEELSRGADVRLLDERTVAVIPKSSGDEEPTERTADGKTDDHRVELHLIFDEAGRLAERRWVQSSQQRVLQRIVFDASGKFRLLDADDTELAVVNTKRERADAPNLDVAEDDRVILPMPVRSVEYLTKQISDTADDGKSSPTKQQQMQLILAYAAKNRGADVAKLIHEHFLRHGDRRDGFYVLLSRFPNNLIWEGDAPDSDGRITKFDLRPSAEGSPLRQFLRQSIAFQRSPERDVVFDIEGPADGFIQRLATAINIYHRWKYGRATEDRTKAQIEKELRAALTFIAECRQQTTGWRLLSAILPKVEQADLNDLLAEAVKPFEGNPTLAMLARQERVRALFKAGRDAKARKLYAGLIASNVRLGLVPRIDPSLRQSFVAPTNGETEWRSLMAKCGHAFVDARLYRTAVVFSQTLRQLDDHEPAGVILDAVLAEVTAETQPDVVLQAAHSLHLLKDGRADDLLNSLLEVDQLRDDPRFWRYAAKVAEDLNHPQLALQRLEQAIHLEFINRPDVVNVETLRAKYSELMKRYEAVIDASRTLEAEVPSDLYARIVRAADQWRSMEDDPTQCCRTTADLLWKLGRKDLSWDYLTTPLAGRSGESSPWQHLADGLKKTKQIDLANLAYSKAFEFEQTNPTILLAHAIMLKEAHRTAEAQRKLRQIVDGSWQPRFNNTVGQARNLLRH